MVRRVVKGDEEEEDCRTGGRGMREVEAVSRERLVVWEGVKEYEGSWGSIDGGREYEGRWGSIDGGREYEGSAGSLEAGWWYEGEDLNKVCVDYDEGGNVVCCCVAEQNANVTS